MLHWSTSGAQSLGSFLIVFHIFCICCSSPDSILMMDFQFSCKELLAWCKRAPGFDHLVSRKQSQHYAISCIYWNSPIFGFYTCMYIHPIISQHGTLYKPFGMYSRCLIQPWQELVHDCGHKHWCLERGRVGAIFTGGSMLSGADISRPVWCLLSFTSSNERLNI